jgi:hypothetical protein
MAFVATGEVLMEPGGRHQSFPWQSALGDQRLSFRISSFVHRATSQASSCEVFLGLLMRTHEVSKQRAELAFG